MKMHEFVKLLGKGTRVPDADEMGDLDCLKIKDHNALLKWESGVYAGSDELSEALNKTIQANVRSAVLLALASLDVMIDERGVCIYERCNHEDVIMVPWRDLLADPNYVRVEEWSDDILKAIKAAIRYNKKKEAAQ